MHQLFLGFNSGGQILVNLLWILSSEATTLNKPSVLEFYNRLQAQVGNESPSKEVQFAALSPRVYYGHYIEFSHHGRMAEMRLFSINLNELVQMAKAGEGGVVESTLRSAVEMTALVQLGIIKSLYLGSAK